VSLDEERVEGDGVVGVLESFGEGDELGVGGGSVVEGFGVGAVDRERREEGRGQRGKLTTEMEKGDRVSFEGRTEVA